MHQSLNLLLAIKNSWIFPIVQAAHLCGIALLVGSIVILDLRVLGHTLRHRDISEVASRLSYWSRIGLVIVLTTGTLLFSSDLARYSHNPAFIFKMLLLFVTLIFQFAVHRRMEQGSRPAAVGSIVLWTSIVLAGRAIADFDA
jgi:hypothetical protein